MSRSGTPSLSLASLSRSELVSRLHAARAAQAAAAKSVAESDSEIARLRGRNVKTQSEAEIEEERLGNTLLKRMDSLRKSNSEVEQAIKSEERRNAGVLAELARVRKNKIDVENRIEVEQERMLNSLQKQLVALATEKAQLERTLQSSREEVLASLHAEVEKLRSRAQTPLHGSDARAEAVATPQSEGRRSRTPSTSVASRPCLTVAALEAELRQLLDETRRAQDESEVANNHYVELCEQLRELQSESLAAKLKMVKMREELEKAHAELATERASNAETPVQPSSETTTGVPPLPTAPSSVRRASHHVRTQSGSSVESWSSASVASTPLNVALARSDPDVVRQHTARVLSTALVYPSPSRGERQSGRSSVSQS